MPLPITIPNTFANATATIPLSQLDNNFSTVAVAVNSIGNGAFSLANVQVTGGAIDNVALTNVTIESQTFNNLTLTNVTISSGNATFATANATNSTITNLSSGNATITGGSISGITDLTIADGGTNASTATVAFNNLSPANTKGDLIVFDGTNNVRIPVGSNDQVLSANSATSTGLAWATPSGGGSSFTSGTLMLFQQTAAPTGWTKQTTHDNKALRVVSGTASSGGSVNFTTAFASQAVNGTVGSTTLSAAQMPSHTHGISLIGGCGGSNVGPLGNSLDSFYGTSSTNSAGSSNSHNHSFSGTAINLAVQYVDLIIASKD